MAIRSATKSQNISGYLDYTKRPIIIYIPK